MIFKNTLEHEMQDIRKEVNQISYKINWNNPELGKAWFNLRYEGHDHYSIIMGVEGITRGWKLDLSKLNSGFKYEIHEEKAKKIFNELNHWFENCMEISPPWWFSKKDLDKYRRLCSLFYENYATRQGKKKYLTSEELRFLDE